MKNTKIYETPQFIVNEVITENGFAISYGDTEGIEGIYINEPSEL